MTTTVIALKLTTGEDVLTRLESEDEFEYVTSYPAYVSIGTNPDGQSGVQIAPFIAFAVDGKVKIKKSAVAAEAEPDSKLADEYTKLFHPGTIQLVSNGKIIV
jgi:hypothetical protein